VQIWVPQSTFLFQAYLIRSCKRRYTIRDLSYILNIINKLKRIHLHLKVIMKLISKKYQVNDINNSHLDFKVSISYNYKKNTEMI